MKKHIKAQKKLHRIAFKIYQDMVNQLNPTRSSVLSGLYPTTTGVLDLYTYLKTVSRHCRTISHRAVILWSSLVRSITIRIAVSDQTSHCRCRRHLTTKRSCGLHRKNARASRQRIRSIGTTTTISWHTVASSAKTRLSLPGPTSSDRCRRKIAAKMRSWLIKQLPHSDN